MKDKGETIGFVTEVIDENNFMFLSNNKTKCQISEIVALYINDREYVLAKIYKIEVDFFLNDSKVFFTSLASDDNLDVLGDKSMRPKYSYSYSSVILGMYSFNSDGLLIETLYSVNKYTPVIFQKVFLFDFGIIKSVYNLTNNKSDTIKLGKILYPSVIEDFSTVYINRDTFFHHTLISGVTGSGKTRLTGLIIQQLAKLSGHITIIDPHNEYEGFFKIFNNSDFKLYRYTINANSMSSIQGDETKMQLKFSSQNYTAQILVKFLPNMTDPQQNYLYKVFSEINSDVRITTKKVIDYIIHDFRISVENEEPDFLTYVVDADKFAKADQRDYDTYCERYLNRLTSNQRYLKSGYLQVIFAVLKKVIITFLNKSFQMQISTWEDANLTHIINILNVDYDSNENIRRFINAILQTFFSIDYQSNSKNRLLVIDEAHLLLNEDSETSKLLSRLLRESRKLGLSLVFITQNEKDVPISIRSQFQNRFNFREETNDLLLHLPSQTCNAKLYNGKLEFSMRVETFSHNRDKSNIC